MKPRTTALRLSPLHWLWRKLPSRRRLWFSRANALLAPRIDRVPPPAAAGIAVVGELCRMTGLGENARLLLRGLQHLAIPHWAIDITELLPSGRLELPALPYRRPPDGVPLLIHVNPPMLPYVLRRLPRDLVRGRRVIGYWIWELPTAPPDWEVGPQFVHEVWVPTSFSAAPIEALMPGRVRVVPPPLALLPPTPSGRDRGSFGLPPDAVVVLTSFNLASSFMRKNPLAAIAAFRQAFGERTDRLLLMKIGNADHYPDDFARIVAAAAGAANIRLMTDALSAGDNLALIAAADIVLSLHRSEGLGLVLAEAMLLGKPVVATGWSGNMAFMDERSAALVGYELTAAEDSRAVYSVSAAVWAEPSLDEAIAHLRRLADDQALRLVLGVRARATAVSLLGGDALGNAVSSLRAPPSAQGFAPTDEHK